MSEMFSSPDIIEMRRQEIAQYQRNIDLYTVMAASLPSEWPAHLAHLKGRKDQHDAIATVENLDDVALVSDLWAHDAAVAALRAETVEMRKSMAILSVLESQNQPLA